MDNILTFKKVLKYVLVDANNVVSLDPIALQV